MKIGFIEIGSIGAAMVPDLFKAGNQVSLWNRNQEAARALEGVTALPSPAAPLENEAVITMLSYDMVARSVILDPSTLVHAKKNCVHSMLATMSPA